MTVSSKSPRSRPLKLEDLNEDCIRLVVDELKHHYEHDRLGSLRSFSTVCRRLRRATSPVIFARCSAPLDINIRGFIPETLWNFIRVLSFTGERSADTAELSVEHLERAMPSFEVLESVRFHEIFGSSIVLAIPAVLTAPHLRALHVIDQCPYSEPDLKDEDLASDLPPDQFPSSIVELRWLRDQWSFATDAQISDEAALIRAIAFPLRLSLQILSFPIESAPIHELSTLVWPHLTDISFTANTPSSATTSSIDFSSILNSMPRLLNLSVLLPQSSSFPRSTILLPGASTAAPPLDSLQSLTLAYPNPADLIFDHLPPSLHHLALTDFPRHYLLLDISNPLYEYSYDSPILTSSELGGILQRCDTPALESLEAVYRADAAEVQTLGMIARRFSGLRTLKMFRYVDSADDPVDASLLASALSPLQHIRHLYVHLNPPETPQLRLGQSVEDRRNALAAFRVALQDTANIFAGVFAGSRIEVIFLLERFYGETRWSGWRVIRKNSGDGDEDEDVNGKQRTYCERADDFEIHREQAAPVPIWNTGFRGVLLT